MPLAGQCAWCAEGVCPSAELGKPSRGTGSSQGRSGGCRTNKSKLHIKGLKVSPETPAPVRFPDFLQNGPTVQCSLPYQTAGHRLPAPPAAGARRQTRACLVVHAAPHPPHGTWKMLRAHIQWVPSLLESFLPVSRVPSCSETLCFECISSQNNARVTTAPMSVGGQPWNATGDKGRWVHVWWGQG